MDMDKEAVDGYVDELLGEINKLQSELHLHREVERMTDELDAVLEYRDNKYTLEYGVEYNSFNNPFPIYHGPYTLQELHNKLTELTEKHK